MRAGIWRKWGGYCQISLVYSEMFCFRPMKDVDDMHVQESWHPAPNTL